MDEDSIVTRMKSNERRRNRTNDQSRIYSRSNTVYMIILVTGTYINFYLN